MTSYSYSLRRSTICRATLLTMTLRSVVFRGRHDRANTRLWERCKPQRVFGYESTTCTRTVHVTVVQLYTYMYCTCTWTKISKFIMQATLYTCTRVQLRVRVAYSTPMHLSRCTAVHCSAYKFVYSRDSPVYIQYSTKVQYVLRKYFRKYFRTSVPVQRTVCSYVPSKVRKYNVLSYESTLKVRKYFRK